MNYNIELTPLFKKEAKKLSKKYPSLKSDLANLFSELEKHPTFGVPLGNNVYKIRLAIASKGKGTSGGARIFSIYNKGCRDSISDKEIQELLNKYR